MTHEQLTAAVVYSLLLVPSRKTKAGGRKPPKDDGRD